MTRPIAAIALLARGIVSAAVAESLRTTTARLELTAVAAQQVARSLASTADSLDEIAEYSLLDAVDAAVGAAFEVSE